MKNTKISILFLLFAANILQGQEPVSALFRVNNPPDSIVQITTVLPGTTQAQALMVEVTDGWARIEGDIVLGRIEELQQMAQDRGIVIDGGNRWPNGEIPYIINSGFTADYIALIHQAIDYVNGTTHLNIHPVDGISGLNWIAFNPSSVCESAVGMQYFIQNISLMDPYAVGNNGTGCYFPQIIHEIAHAAGLWHEQSREDRDAFVTIHPENILANKLQNFNKHISDGIDIGPYDFASDMHYSQFAFSANGQPTITANGGQTFGNALEYSDGDIATINWMYPVRFCPFVHDLSASIYAVSRPLVFEATSLISSTATVVNGNEITYDAGASVTLNPGFQTALGSVFQAVIEGCGGVYQMTNSGDMDEWIYNAEQHQQNKESSAPTTLIPIPTATAASVDVTPNPFATSTVITYTLPVDQEVDIQIFNAIGNLVAQPVRQEQQAAGVHEFNFEANGLPMGIYFLVMQAEGKKLSKRLVLTK